MPHWFFLSFFTGLFKVMSGSDWTDSLLKFVTYGTVVGISATQGGDPLQPPCSTWGTAHHPHRCSRYSLLNNPHPLLLRGFPRPDAGWMGTEYFCCMVRFSNSSVGMGRSQIVGCLGHSLFWKLSTKKCVFENLLAELKA